LGVFVTETQRRKKSHKQSIFRKLGKIRGGKAVDNALQRAKKAKESDTTCEKYDNNILNHPWQ
jgi:hypothetical protein